MEDVPPLVRRAMTRARTLGFPLSREEAGNQRPSACLPGTGRFLAVLAAGCVAGRIGELGTGAGVGAAWMASAMPADCTLITVERDERLADASRQMLAGDGRVQVITAEATAALAGLAPFDLLFADCGVRDQAQFAALVALLRPGGRIVMDDLTPRRALAPESPFLASDLKRELFSGCAGLLSTEVVLPDLRNSLLVGTLAGPG